MHGTSFFFFTGRYGCFLPICLEQWNFWIMKALQRNVFCCDENTIRNNGFLGLWILVYVILCLFSFASSFAFSEKCCSKASAQRLELIHVVHLVCIKVIIILGKACDWGFNCYFSRRFYYC